MELINKLYLRFYFIVMLLYAIFNKGIAYTFLVELLLVVGVLLISLNRQHFQFLINNKYKVVIGLIIITFFYIVFNVFVHPIIDVIRDSFVIEYALFAIIIYFFKNEANYIWDWLIQIYKWVPLILFLNFFIFYYVVVNLPPIEIFGGQPLFLYKNGDKSVHLLISTLFLFIFSDKYNKKWLIVNAFLIILNFLILLAFTRSGSVAFLIGIFSFFFFNKQKIANPTLQNVVKLLPLFLIISIALFVSVEFQGDAQGRTLGFGQIADNFSSIVGNDVDGSLTDNKVWRLLWWAKLLDESLTPAHFIFGKGIGMSLASNDLLSTEENLRSPHNYNLTLLARFGYLFLFIWFYFIYLVIKPMVLRKLNSKQLAVSAIIIAFIINASFDVYLEGPMGAFPFWTFVGLLFIMEDQSLPQVNT
jgi:hypothetical protein